MLPRVLAARLTVQRWCQERELRGGAGMGARRQVRYADAVALLGGDPAVLKALDTALGNALGLATGGTSDTVLNLVGAQGQILRLGRRAMARLRESLAGADRAARTERLAAAHTVIVITAFFEELAQAQMPFDWDEVQLTRQEQLALVGHSALADSAAQDFVRQLAAADAPLPAPHRPYEQVLSGLRLWYEVLSSRLLLFIRGLAVGEQLREGEFEQTTTVLGGVASSAVEHYQELYARLAADIPEFGFWTGQVEHQATRASVREALSGVESLLAGLAASLAPVDVAGALSTGYRATLDRPILAQGDAPSGILLPTAAESYLDPRFRVRALGSGRGPADEDWWEPASVREDLSEFLAGALTGPAAATAPLVVLGQPGAGKSMLTRVLAARLPAAGFLPVRIVLREVPADADVQDQVEYAIRSATGERATWPDLVRAAPGTTPVLLFDGFDELLQATGVSQSDFLTRVAAFQQREADQGRPVVALVTTRTAVADRARYPEGSVALRLEPFSEEQTRTWVALWNRVNAGYFTGSGRRPLPAATIERQRDLAAQPLLLLMLALYDAPDNALQQDGEDGGPLDEAGLYEDLLGSFATREIRKSSGVGHPGQERDRVQEELERLSLVAFAMLNRRRQWVAGDELAADLTALLGRTARTESGFRAPLDHAEIALGRFFFVQKAQALRDEQPLATYEFLHATFGEYLAVRLAVNLLHGLLGRRSALMSGPTRVPDDLLYALLSYVPLSSRQMLRFVHARVARIPAADRDRLADLLLTLRHSAAARTTPHEYADYAPDPARSTAARHGVYDANLVLLLLALTEGVTASQLFPASDDPAEGWHRSASLWRSSFTETEWTDFALSLRLEHTWAGSERELVIRAQPLDAAPIEPEPVDARWVYGRESGEPGSSWWRPYAPELAHKLDVTGGTIDSIIRLTLEPVLAYLGDEVMTFGVGEDGTGTSWAHMILDVWLSGRFAESDQDLTAVYERLLRRWISLEPVNRSQLIHALLAEHSEHLPSGVVTQVLQRLDDFGLVRVPGTVTLAAANALIAGPSATERDLLLEFLRWGLRGPAVNDHYRWEAWVRLHECGLQTEIPMSSEDLRRAATRLTPTVLAALPTYLRLRLQRVLAEHYPERHQDHRTAAEDAPDPVGRGSEAGGQGPTT